MATTYSNVLLRFDGKVSIASGSSPVKVRGSNGADTVTIGTGVEVVLDGSFNRGNDVINFTGLASSYSIVRLSSSSILVTDAQGTSVTIPVGTVGATLQFADASRELKGSATGITLGTQTVTTTAATVAAGTGTAVPFAPNADVGAVAGADANQSNVVVLAQDSKLVLGEDTDPTTVRGSNGADTVTIAEGAKVVLDGSFNRGNDTIILTGNADDYSIVKSGSSAVKITDAAGTSVTIPVGVNGTTIQFADAERELVGSAAGITLGAQTVSNVATTITQGEAVAGHVFTLTEAVVEGTEGTPATSHQEVYWGYVPNHHGNSPSDVAGIPLTSLIEFVTTITGLDLAELGLIDDNGNHPFENVTSLSISNPMSVGGATVEDDSVLHIEFADGTFADFNVEAQIGEQYFAWLNSLLFDEDGNSRLYMETIQDSEGTDGTEDSLQPIKLTPTENNGGTLETGKTSRGNDTIVAGRLELLHQAYIDGGAGYNTLVIDAKGTYAQPAELLNIQEIRINDLPNFYTTSYGNGEGNLENTVVNGSGFLSPTGNGSDDSWIDLTNARELEKLVISDQSEDSGNLFVVGVQDAVVRFEGAFNGGSTTVQFADVSPNGVSVELSVGDVNENINILQNSAVLNINSLGIENHLHSFFTGGTVSRIYVTGSGTFGVEEDIARGLNSDVPVLIDAHANTGGIFLNIGTDYSGPANVTVLGSTASDRVVVETRGADQSVTITDTTGNNTYEVESDGVVSITAGDGNNTIEAEGETVTVALGGGVNSVEVEAEDLAKITAGNGNNTVEASVDHRGGVVDITLGNGANTVDAAANTVKVVTGTGTDTIRAEGSVISVTSGGGSDTIQIVGTSHDYVDDQATSGNNTSGGVSSSANGDDGALITINAGTGSAKVILGDDARHDEGTITALSGSTITGSSVTLVVATEADLRAATLTGVTKVILDDDNGSTWQSPSANEAVAGGNASVLTLTSSQFKAIGAANFSVDGAVFNTHSFLKIIVDSNTSLTALGVDSLPRNIDLILEIKDGVTVTMTAQQLHERIAQDGVLLADDGNTDLAAGKVVITGGGLNFDPFNTSDTVSTVIDGDVYYGGSLSDDFLHNSQYYNVTVNSVFGGYDRPADAVSDVVLTVDSNVTPSVTGLVTFHTNLEIVGDDDVTFTTPVKLGMLSGNSVNTFNIDFSQLEGEVKNFVVDNFEQLSRGGSIVGNSAQGVNSEVLVSIGSDADADSIEFDGNETLHMQGVNKLTVTTIENISGPATATINLGETVIGLATVALRGNYQDTLVVNKAAWGTVFELQGGGTAASEGPAGTSNVGNIIASYEWANASAVVNVTHANASDTRPISVGDVTVNNASSIKINATGGTTTVKSVAGADTQALDASFPLKTLTLAGTSSLTVTTDLPTSLTKIDAAGVVGTATFGIDGPASTSLAKLVIIGGTAGSTISLNTIQEGDITSITGAGPIKLNLDGTSAVDLSATTLTNVTAVTMVANADLTLTMAQVDAIGASHISGPATGVAGIHLEGLGSQVFAVANFGANVDVESVVVVNQPNVTLNAATSLAGVDQLEVPEGVTLTLTAAQYLQLGSGGITIVNTDSSVADKINVVITGLTQADVDAGFTTNDIFVGGGTVTVTLAESVDFSESTSHPLHDDSNNPVTVNVGAGLTLTLGDIQDGDGLNVVGAANSTLKFTDTATALFEDIDASGFNVTTLKFTNTLTEDGNRNIDDIFTSLPGAVVKVVYNGEQVVQEISQVVTIEAGTTVTDSLTFNPADDTQELQNFTINLMGGTEISGSLRLTTEDKLVNGKEPLRTFLQTVTINSTGTAANLLSGKTGNIITGDVTPKTIIFGTENNNLLDLTINATAALTIGGTVVFNANGANQVDSIAANDKTNQTAKLTINGSSNVTLGNIDLTDGDIVGLNAVNNGTGKVFTTIDSSDAGKKLSFTGTGTFELTTSTSVDLTDDVLTAVSKLNVSDNTTLTLTYAQYQALTSANIKVVDGSDGNTTIDNASLVITGYTGGAFDAGLDAKFNSVTLTMAAGTYTIDPSADLSKVTQINVPSGGVLTLTAAQFQQLSGTGSIDAVSGSFVLNITGLTQALVNQGFSLADVSGASAVNITLGEASVTLAEYLSGNALSSSFTDVSVLNSVTAFALTSGQTLGLVNYTQANGLTVTGGAGTTVVYKFDADAPSGNTPAQINVSKYDIGTLKALAASFGLSDDLNVEFVLDDLKSSVTLSLFDDPATLGFLSTTNRVVVIEAGVATPGGLTFNDLDDDAELKTLKLTLSGGSTLNGDLNLSTDAKPSLPLTYLSSLTIDSVGATPNTINGSIDAAAGAFFGDVMIENNLKSVTINASQALTIAHDIVFHAVSGATSSQSATLTVTGTANVTLENLDVSDNQIGTLNIANTGTGTLTVTGASPAIYDTIGLDTTANLENLVLTGTGNIILHGAGALTGGIMSSTISTINASGLSGELDLGLINDIDGASFAFTSGTGKTTLTLVDDTFGAGTGTQSWSFDLTNAGNGSAFHLGSTAGGSLTLGDGLGTDNLTIHLGTKAVLYIDENTNFTAIENLVIDGAQDIVVKNGVTVTLTAAQANGLHIVGESGATSTGVVNIVGLADGVVYDFSHISATIAGTITLADDDVTVEAATNLGAANGFTIQLFEVNNSEDSLAGQTIRFNTAAQAERDIRVGNYFYGQDTDPLTGGIQLTTGTEDLNGSTNVVYLFTSLDFGARPNGIDTSGYDAEIGRLWVTPQLIASAPAHNVENIYTTLPSTVVRVEFPTIAFLNAALAAATGVDRVMEVVHFTDLTDISFNDLNALPTEEYVKTLTVKLGGDVTIGNIDIADVVADVTTDPASVHFDDLTIVSRSAVKTGELLAAAAYNNNNDATVTTGEQVQPTAANVIGAIGVGAGNANVDLLSVHIDVGTHLDTANVGNGATDNNRGEDLEIASITYDSEDAGETADLFITGVNDVTIGSITTSDVDIDTLNIDLTGFSGVLDPILHVDNTETVVVENDDDAAGEATFNYVEGNELSDFDASDFGGKLNVVLSQMDSSDDVGDVAFTYTAGTGDSDVVVKASGAHTPVLNAGSTWVFDFAAAGTGSTLTFNETASDGLAVGSGLIFDSAQLYITGDVDFSDVNLSWLNGSDNKIFVGANNTLTITLAQAGVLQSAGIDIVGEGTVKLVGDATNAGVANTYNFTVLETAVVDASAVTINTATDFDDRFQLTLHGARNLADTLQINQTVIGTDFDDTLAFVNPSSDFSFQFTFDGGLGDDRYSVTGGDMVYVSTDGSDAVVGAAVSESPATPDNTEQSDVITVSAGATLTAATSTFTDTGASTNAGTVNLSALSAGGSLIDMTLAGGPNGYNLTGSTSATTGADVLKGSAFADVINGGNSQQTAAAAKDTLTGNGGADQFVFNVLVSSASAFTKNVFQVAIDVEEIDFTGLVDDDSGNESINVTYERNNGTPVIVTINDTTYGSDIDFTDATAVAKAVSEMLDGKSGIGSTYTGSLVSVTGDAGAGIEITSISFSNVATTPTSTAYNVATTFFGDAIVGSDQEQIIDLTVIGNPSNGDVYSLTADFFAGGNYTAPDYVAGSNEDNADVATGLVGQFNTAAVADVIGSSSNIIRFTDSDANDGGFDVGVDTTAAFAGSGASITLDGTYAHDVATADVITDFNAAQGDVIDFTNMAAGSVLNFASLASSTDYEDAFDDANTVFAASGGSIQYFLTSTTDLDGAASAATVASGLLFVDANTDGTADLVVLLNGITNLNFSSGNIA